MIQVSTARPALYLILLLPLLSACNLPDIFRFESKSLEQLAAALPAAADQIDPLRIGQILREKNTLAEKVAALQRELDEAKNALTSVTVVVGCSASTGSNVLVRLETQSEPKASRELQRVDCTGTYHLVLLDTAMQFSPGRYTVVADYYAAPGTPPTASLTVADTRSAQGRGLSGTDATVSALATRAGVFCRQEVSQNTISLIPTKEGAAKGSLMFSQSCSISLKTDAGADKAGAPKATVKP